MVLIVYVATLAAGGLLAEEVLGPGLTRAPMIQNLDQSSAAHVVARLLEQSSVVVLLICGLSAVVISPVVEEFMFRVLLQGWLEAGQRRLRPAMPTLRRWVPGAVGPIVLSSLLFAGLHFRVEAPMRPVRFVTFMVAVDAVAKLVTLVFAVALIRVRTGATAADFGWVPAKLAADVKLGLTAFAGLAAPIYALQFALMKLLPKYLAPDPFVLLLFAIALGTLYYRTHRIAASVVLHMALNTTSLFMALLWLWAGS
jgi:membrane protease YdiL (CAAX protease family)